MSAFDSDRLAAAAVPEPHQRIDVVQQTVEIILQASIWRSWRIVLDSKQTNAT